MTTLKYARLMSPTRAIGISAAFLTGAIASAEVLGPEWEEPSPPDAGSLPSGAMPVTGPAATPVLKIKGRTSVALKGPGDFEDMYLIHIVDPVGFCASTDDPDTMPGYDTRLWLFRPDGKGLLANDNIAAGNDFSRILPISTDGSGASLTVPGYYYLAITGAPSTPRSAPTISGEIFSFASAIEISGPDGPGAFQPIQLWNLQGAVGYYAITLCGVELIPCPGDVSPNAEVGFDDLLVLLSNWGSPCEPCAGDLDEDESIDFDDLLLLLSSWGPCLPQ